MNGFSPNSVCALILWRSGQGLFMGKFHQFLTELPARDRSVFSFSVCLCLQGQGHRLRNFIIDP